MASNTRTIGAKPRGGKWTRPPRTKQQGRGGILLVLAFAAALIGGALGFAWEMNRQVESGILRQRTEAARRPDWVPIRTLPPYVAPAFQTVVDPTFAERKPLDEGAEGSTVSRNLVRQVHLLRPGMAGEAREILLGPLLEQHLAKSEVMELYLNRVYLGQASGYPVYGVHHAAREFFGKPPQQLSLSEAATLAGMLLPPRIVRPEDQLGAVGARRNEVLRQLRASGAITPQQLAEAVQQPLSFVAVAEYAPMTRPAGWSPDPEPLRLPPLEPTAADSAAARTGSS